MEGISIEIELKWVKSQTDCSNCKACEDIIVSDMWELMMIACKGEPSTTGVKICNSCYEAMNDDK